MVYVPRVRHACALRASSRMPPCTCRSASTRCTPPTTTLRTRAYSASTSRASRPTRTCPTGHSELVGDGAYPRGRHRPSSLPGVTEGAGRTYAPTAERSLGRSVVASEGAARSLSLERPRDALEMQLTSLEREANLRSLVMQLSRFERAGTGSCESSDKESQWSASETRSTSTRRWNTSLGWIDTLTHVHLLATRSTRRSHRRGPAYAPVHTRTPPLPPLPRTSPCTPGRTLTQPCTSLRALRSPYTPYLPLQVTQKEFGFPKKHNLEVHTAPA
jgi:hypothetical protein